MAGTERSKLRSFRFLHLALAALGLLLSAALILSDDHGHPPAIILLPVVLVGWLVGHAFLAFIHWIVRRQRRAHGGAEAARWPWPLVVLCAAFAGVFFVQLNGIGWSLLVNNEAFAPRRLLLLVLFVLPAPVVLVGLLARKPWGRYVCAAVPICFFLFAVLRIGAVVLAGKGLGVDGALVALIYLGVSGGAGWYLLKSSEVRRFFGSPEARGS